MENTNIAWAHNTQNFWLGCKQVAPECGHCYFGRILLKYKDPVTKKSRDCWNEIWRTKTQKNPAKWQKACGAEGVCRRVFTNTDYRLAKTTKDERNSNPTWGPYKVVFNNTVKDSGTLEDLFARARGRRRLENQTRMCKSGE